MHRRDDRVLVDDPVHHLVRDAPTAGLPFVDLGEVREDAARLVDWITCPWYSKANVPCIFDSMNRPPRTGRHHDVDLLSTGGASGPSIHIFAVISHVPANTSSFLWYGPGRAYFSHRFIICSISASGPGASCESTSPDMSDIATPNAKPLAIHLSLMTLPFVFEVIGPGTGSGDEGFSRGKWAAGRFQPSGAASSRRRHSSIHACEGWGQPGVPAPSS